MKRIVTANEKSLRNREKRKELKHNTTESHQYTRKENKRIRNRKAKSKKMESDI